MDISRRRVFQGVAVAGAVAAGARAAAGAEVSRMSPVAGPFKPDWQSLIDGYRAPDWFRDAKFGIWAHWGVQSVPEFGDWYFRWMYAQGTSIYDHHLKHYGHPADTGFMDITRLWTIPNWDPERLVDLYQKAGAKYFVALANHHDNFDNYDSTYQPWNATRIGPKRDVIGTWAKVARARGLPFGVSNHSAHAWHLNQIAYSYDAEGPRRGERYDAYRLTKADGVGKWWEGLDPQDLYTGRSLVMPDGFSSIIEADQWREQNDRQWYEEPPANNPAFVRTWTLRCRDLIDKYRPDLVYFDDYDLPLGQAGLDIAAHYYNSSLSWHGKLQAVINCKRLMARPLQRFGVVEDVERGGRVTIDSAPWQTDTCIGNWHYDRALYDSHGYKSSLSVIHTLCDVVSKNGNLLLSVPLRADGTHDDQELAFLAEMGAWMATNGEAIYGSRPWRTFGEGPNNGGGGDFAENNPVGYCGKDIRFTTKAGALYAMVMAWPETGLVKLTSLAKGAPIGRGEVERVDLLGVGEPLTFRRTSDALEVQLPDLVPAPRVWVLKLQGTGLVG
jgi:alpha-L-fucosidase